MPDKEQLGVLAVLELLAILYVVGLVIKYVVEYWYVVAPAVAGLISLRVWWRRRCPVRYDEENCDVEPVSQE